MTDQDRRAITAKIKAKAAIARFEGMAARIANEEETAPGHSVESIVSVSYTVNDRHEIPGVK
jgi:hypothetical protein